MITKSEQAEKVQNVVQHIIDGAQRDAIDNSMVLMSGIAGVTALYKSQRCCCDVIEEDGYQITLRKNCHCKIHGMFGSRAELASEGKEKP